jgi:hypothetical protein
VSGLPGEVDEALARQALEATGLGIRERRTPTDKPTAGA